MISYAKNQIMYPCGFHTSAQVTQTSTFEFETSSNHHIADKDDE